VENSDNTEFKNYKPRHISLPSEHFTIPQQVSAPRVHS